MCVIQISATCTGTSAPARTPTTPSATGTAYVWASVVRERPRHRAREVAEHREIGCQGEDDEEPPRVAEMEVERDRGDGDDRTFDVQEESRDATGHPGIVDRRLVWKAAPHEYGSIPSAEPLGHVSCRQRSEEVEHEG